MSITNKSIAKSSTVISLATLCSRLLGFVRDIVIAKLFGVYVYAQAFVIAFRVPNLLRDFVAEGASGAAFVPVFSEYLAKRSKEEFWELANVVLNLVLVVLTVLTLLGMALAPLVVRLIAPGFILDPYKLSITVNLTRILFPYILLVGLAAYVMALLNSLRHFTVSAFAPCFLNVSIIIFVMIFKESTKGLVLGVLVGGLLQLLVQIPVLYKKGFRLHLFRRFRHPAADQIGKLMVPRLASSSIYQLNNFVDSIFGSLARIVGEGGVAVLYFAYRLIQFPVGIFSNALSQAMLPTLSTQASRGDYDNLKESFLWGLRMVFFVMLPASVGFMVLSKTIIQSLFEGGKFDFYATIQTADVLFFYSIGLFAYGATKITQYCFFALKDTLTPAKVSALTLFLNIVFNAIFMFPLKIAGLALATSLSGIVSFLVLIFLLERKIGGLDIRKIAISFIRILLASLAMGLVCFWVSRNISISGGMLYKLLGLLVTILFGFVSYILFCFIIRVPEMQEIWNWIKERK